MRLSLLCFVVVCTAFTSSCALFDSTCDESDRYCLGNPFTAGGYGDPCDHDRDCRQGLFCIDHECKPNGTTKRGEKCRLTAECMQPDYCGTCNEGDKSEYANCIPPTSAAGTASLIRVCQEAGTATLDDNCGNTGECVHGLICEAPDFSAEGVASLGELASLSGQCKEGGEGEQGDPCETVADCLPGLTCVDKQLYCDATMLCGDASIEEGAKICALDLELPPIPPLWKGLECPAVEDDDPTVAYFHVPRSGEDDPTEFFSLPFPNDIRRDGNGVDLSQYPVPPPTLGLPIVNRYVDAAAKQPGFSTNPTVYFRFSHPYSMNNAVVQQAISLIDITDKTQPEYNQIRGIEWHTTAGRVSNYICPHWLGIKPTLGSPLQAGRTYAAIITRALPPQKGGAFARSPDFDAMLSGSEPGDAALAAAYATYAPLRAWITDTNQSADNILSAAVFTTQSAEALIEGMRAAIHADALPTISDATVCASENTVSPCESIETVKKDGVDVMEDRGKCTISPDFTVIHARIKLPIFQKGTPPYRVPEDGGDLKLDINGRPAIERREDICVAISVPTAPMPPTGFPVLVYAHGTGGNFAGEMDQSGFAGAVARGSVPSVLVAIDMPQHGSRRGEGVKDEPDGLFYNFLNPQAARDNVLQGAGDLMAMVRWVKESGGLAAGDPLPTGVLFDPTRIALMGHSQGATHSSLMVSFEPDIVGAVLSGNGGALAQSLMTKTSPVDIASVIPFGLQDPDKGFKLAGGDFNPALSAVQWVFDVADPVNYATYLVQQPRTLAPQGHHVFMTWGVGDTYSPEETQRAYVRAVGRQMLAVSPVFTPLTIAMGEEQWPTSPPGLTANTLIGGAQRTVGVRQYNPKGDTDGHFVGTSPSQDGRPDVERFLNQLLSNTTPTIGQ
jgi:hypothetical protein